jgi:hypothetical protein
MLEFTQTFASHGYKFPIKLKKHLDKEGFYFRANILFNVHKLIDRGAEKIKIICNLHSTNIYVSSRILKI